MPDARRLCASVALFLCVACSPPSPERPPSYSDIRDDEVVQFFRTSAWLDPGARIWHIPIHGWVYEPENSVARKAAFEAILEREYELAVTGAHAKNFDRRLNLLIADNERGKTIVINLAGEKYELPPSAENGHVQAVLHLPVETVERHADGDMLSYRALARGAGGREFRGEVRLVPPAGISIISDIDDTVKISEVTDRERLLRNTFLLDFAPAPGMAERYGSWANGDVSFHFVSSSPWQLYGPLQEFLDDSGFPWSTFSLKAVRFRDETLFNLFKKGTETKPAVIEDILSTYPDRQFVLVGDSGEQDPEVYAGLLRQHPDRIRGVFIRNVTRESADNERFTALFHGIDNSRWKLFDDPSSLELPPP